MRVHFVGRLRHHFHGEYGCTIALAFDDTASALDARRVLNGPGDESPWGIGSTSRKALVAVLSSAGLDAFKATLQRSGMAAKELAKIDSVRFSVDVGEPFAGSLDVTPAEQAPLFG